MTAEKKALIESSFGRNEWLQQMGATLEEVAVGFVSIKLPKQSYMTRKAGMFNGAIMASLVDVSSGYAAVSAKPDDCYVVTVELKVNYLNPAMGDALLSRSYVVKNGAKISVIRTEIFCISGEAESHVATSLVTMMRLK